MSLLDAIFFTYRVNIHRESFVQDANGVLTASGWELVAENVPAYKEAQPNVSRAAVGGRILNDNWLSMDVWHLPEGFDVRADDAIQNVTLADDGSRVADWGDWWRVRGAPQSFASMGLLNLGRMRLLAFPTGPVFDPEGE
jgi:hypothetical protein